MSGTFSCVFHSLCPLQAALPLRSPARDTPVCIVHEVLRGRVFPGVCILARQRSSIPLIAHDVDGGIFRERREAETTQRRRRRYWLSVETMMDKLDGWMDRQLQSRIDRQISPQTSHFSLMEGRNFLSRYLSRGSASTSRRRSMNAPPPLFTGKDGRWKYQI